MMRSQISTSSTCSITSGEGVQICVAITFVCGLSFLLAVGANAVATILLCLCAIVMYLIADLEKCLLVTIPAVLVDPQVMIRGQRVYCDVLFILLIIPILRARLLPRAWLLMPFAVYSIATGVLLALNRFWFMAFSLRLITSAILCAAVSAVKDSNKLLRVLCFSSIPLSLFGLYQILIGDYGKLYFAINRGFFDYEVWRSRAFSVFSTDNVFGGFSAVVATISLGLVLKQRDRVQMVCCILAVMAMIASGSRGAWIGFAIGAAYLVMKGKTKLIAIYVASLSVVGLAIAEVFPDRLNLEQFIIDTRLELWGAALVLFLSHPFVGVGLTNFSELMPTVIPWEYQAVGAHNLYLQILAEGGIVGLCLLFVPIIWVTRKAGDRVAIAALLVSLGHQCFDYLWNDPRYLMLTAIVLGLIVQSTQTKLITTTERV